MQAKLLERPPFILAHPADQHGCGYYRIYKPLESFIANGYASARAESVRFPDDVLQAMAPDVVIWQRQNSDAQIEMIQAYRRLLPGAFFIFEIDDALSAIPDRSFHKPFMSPTIDDRLPRAAALCDIITVTTTPLQAHMQALCPDKEIRIVPNMLTQQDIINAAAVRAKGTSGTGKLRVGWGGGIGHTGDLALLDAAILALKDEVEWVFIGHKPDMPDCAQYRYVDAVPPPAYVEALAGLDVDLIVAPLEDNHFNRCKSNLRIIEAGACQYPVLASPVHPYLHKRPPVDYADNDAEWIENIRAFAALSAQGRRQKAQDLHEWVCRHYIADDRLYERMQQWLPRTVKAFPPKHAKPDSLRVTRNPETELAAVERKLKELEGEVDSDASAAPLKRTVGRGVSIVRGAEALITACYDTAFDVVYVRDGIQIADERLHCFAQRSLSYGLATASAVTNDGGPAGYPQCNGFVPIAPEYGEEIAILAEAIGGVGKMPCCSGPVVLLTRRAIDLIGPPDFERWEHVELALLEWSISAAARTFRNIVDLGTFAYADQPLQIHPNSIEQLSKRLSARWQTDTAPDPTIDKFRELLELRFSRGSFRTAPPRDPRDYAAWTKKHDTLGASGMEACYAWYNTTKKPQIDVIYYTDESLTPDMLPPVNSDRWALFLRKGTLPAMTTMAHAVQAIEQNPDALAFYGDHDFVVDGVRTAHDFKPNPDIHLLLGRDYVSQVMLVHPSMMGLLVSTPAIASGAAARLYELALMLLLDGNDYPGALFAHIPRVMAHLEPPPPNVTVARALATATVAATMAERADLPVTVTPHAELQGYHKVAYRSAEQPKVSVIIPTKDNLEMIAPCVATLLQITDYPNMEVLIVDNGSTKPETLAFFAGQTDARVRVLRYEAPFNWSNINNHATKHTDAEIYCFLNDDTRVLESHWLREMVGAAAFPRVGAVGAKLSYPHGLLQHIGVVSAYGTSGHMLKGHPIQYAGYNGIAALSHEAAAVTGACMVVRKGLFDMVSGFNEQLANNFNDVDFCLRLRKFGYVSVVAAGAHLMHIESATRAPGDTPAGFAALQADTAYMRAHFRDPDPYWNPNLLFAAVNDMPVVIGLDMDTLAWPPAPNPWDRTGYQRVLVVGAKEAASSEIRDKDAVYHMLIQGNLAQIVEPHLQNVRPFDLRDPDTALAALAELGIDKIIIGALEDGSTQLLHFLSRLSIPVVYRPRTAESVCPRRNLQTNKGPCSGGWKRPGACQRCIDLIGSPNGYVTVEAWRSDWQRFFDRGNVKVEMEYLESGEYGSAISDIFGAGSGEDLSAA